MSEELNAYDSDDSFIDNSVITEGMYLFVYTRSLFYKKRSKNLASLDFAFLYSCFLFLMMHFG